MRLAMRAPASVRLSLLLSLIALFLPGSLSRQAFAQWSGAARDTLTHDSFRDENTPQSLVVDTSNTLHVIWERANAGTGWRIFYAHGRAASWTPPVEVGDSSLASYNPALAVEHNTGIPVVAYQASYGLSDEINKLYYNYAIRNGAGTSFNAYPQADQTFLLTAEYRL